MSRRGASKRVARSSRLASKGSSARIEQMSTSRKEIRDIEELPGLFEEDTVMEVREALLDWWDEDDGKLNRRATPWRTMEKDDVEKWAYGVWISEVMLQQTQTDRVVKYWENWMTLWPTYKDLAKASLDEVRAAWTGLGYYRRAEYLLLGAQAMVANGGLPRSRDEWLSIKGVGAYTAAAVASVCFSERVPLVDGNVIRVFSRLKKINLSIKSSAAQKIYWQLAGQLVDNSNSRPGDTNQALMELGATVCTKSATPKCDICPLQHHCALKLQALNPLHFPPPNKATNTKQVHLAVGIALRRDATFALIKEPKSTSLLAHDGMWHLPTAPDLESLKNMTLELGFSSNHFVAIQDTIDHSITSTRYKLQVYLIDVNTAHHKEAPGTVELAPNTNLAWVSEAELVKKGSSSIVTKALTHFRRAAHHLSSNDDDDDHHHRQKSTKSKSEKVIKEYSLSDCAALLLQ